jgi:large subunit ribosomal protein L23
MSQARLMKIILALHQSEKADNAAEQRNQVVFKVVNDATKQEIKQAVELLFEVKVKNVCTLNVKGKQKTFGRVRGRRANWKKAYVGLAEGFDINFGLE